MFASIARSAFAVAVLAAAVFFVPARGSAQDEKPEEANKKAAQKKATQQLLERAEEEYRIFFRRPTTVPQFWAAIKFEMNVGKFDLAALHLKMLLQKEPAADVDKELLKIEDAQGLASFVRLQTVRKWSDNRAFQQEAEKNAKTLIDRVTKALDKYLGNADRLNLFIKNLEAPTIEERLFALAQLQRSRERAVPYLVASLRTSVGTPLHDRVVEALLKLDAESITPLFEVLKAADAKDARDLDVRLTVLDIAKRRADKRVVPYLWHLSSAAMYPAQIRAKATALLAYFLATTPEQLPDPKIELTRLAERYYKHQARLARSRSINVWPWNGQSLANQPVKLTGAQAEEYFGLRYAREALDLDPKYRPAQIVLLSLTLERTLAPELNQALLRPMPPKLGQLLATVDPELLTVVLERGLDEGNVPVILATVQALGQRGETRAAKLAASGKPHGLVRALYFPDRRVQFAAAQALLHMPARPVTVAAARIVEVLKRFLSADTNPKALVAFVPPDKAAAARQTIKALGYEPVFVSTGKQIFDRLSASADYDVVFLGSAAPPREFPYLLSNLRADADQGSLPILVFAESGQKAHLADAAGSYRDVRVYAANLIENADELKGALDSQMRDAGIVKLTPAERKALPWLSLDALWRMGRGEFPGYDLRPAQEAVADATRNADLALLALETLGRTPGQTPQARLAAVVLDGARGKLRLPAAIELNRHIQRFGLMLDNMQRGDLQKAYRATADDAALRGQLALVVGSMNPGSRATGVSLHEFRPDVPAPAVQMK